MSLVTEIAKRFNVRLLLFEVMVMIAFAGTVGALGPEPASGGSRVAHYVKLWGASCTVLASFAAASYMTPPARPHSIAINTGHAHPHISQLMSVLFYLLGWLGIAFGLVNLPAAFFVGPHLFAVGLGSVGFGIGSLKVEHGLRRGAQWSTWTAILLCAIVIAVASFAVVQATQAAEWDSVAVWATIAIFFAAVLIAVYIYRSDSSPEQ